MYFDYDLKTPLISLKINRQTWNSTGIFGKKDHHCKIPIDISQNEQANLEFFSRAWEIDHDRKIPFDISQI
jgi:hypothetical protein